MAISLKANPEQDTQTELSQGRNRDRDEFQQMIDGQVKELVQAWREKGAPAPLTNAETGAAEPNPEAPTLRYTVDQGERNAMKQVIRRACTLYKADAVWYKDAARDDGTVTVKFSPGPKKATASAESNGQAEAPAETSAETPAETPEASDQSAQDQETPEQEQSGRRGFRRN
jgi:hypothetical protein